MWNDPGRYMRKNRGVFADRSRSYQTPPTKSNGLGLGNLGRYRHGQLTLDDTPYTDWEIPFQDNGIVPLSSE